LTLDIAPDIQWRMWDGYFDALDSPSMPGSLVEAQAEYVTAKEWDGSALWIGFLGAAALTAVGLTLKTKGRR